tara:strand:+ start:620 stop:799 length:180 start_codon:yes stop_codon:yes gene_type:complete
MLMPRYSRISAEPDQHRWIAGQTFTTNGEKKEMKSGWHHQLESPLFIPCAIDRYSFVRL